MDNQLLFAVSAFSSLISYSIIAGWYIVPRLRAIPRVNALLPLILLSTFRAIGLAFLIPQVTGAPLPSGFAMPAASGDLLAMMLAFLAVFALRLRWPFALVLVWIFNIEGTVDLLSAIFQGILFHIPNFQLGPVWFIPTLYVPMLLVSHILIFWLLVRRSPSVQRELIQEGGVHEHVL